MLLYLLAHRADVTHRLHLIKPAKAAGTEYHLHISESRENVSMESVDNPAILFQLWRRHEAMILDFKRLKLRVGPFR